MKLPPQPARMRSPSSGVRVYCTPLEAGHLRYGNSTIWGQSFGQGGHLLFLHLGNGFANIGNFAGHPEQSIGLARSFFVNIGYCYTSASSIAASALPTPLRPLKHLRHTFSDHPL